VPPRRARLQRRGKWVPGPPVRPALHLALLGGFAARLASGDTLALPAKKAQALLAYLALRPDEPHRRDSLAALLWG
jgi:DNA-binding SARP family transcriptional activator